MTSLLHSPAPAAPTAPVRGRRRIIIAVLAGLLLILIVVMAPTALRLLRDPAAGDAVVGIDAVTVTDDAFDPPVIEVAQGTAVTWTFDDGGRAHNVVADDWSSEVLTTGTYTRTFTEVGSHVYRCTLHWGMEGRVDVVAAR